MRPLRILLLAMSLCAAAALPAGAVDVKRVVSDKGVEAWLVENHSNPIVSMSFAFRGAGGIVDPPGKAGTVNMLSGMLDEGAGDMDSYAFQKLLEDKAIRMNFDAGRDNFGGSLKTLAENRELAFDMLRLALTRPRLDAEPLERVRSQIQAGLARELQDPDVIAGRRWMALLFPEHPYGTAVRGTPESVAAVTRDDLLTVIRQRFARDNLVVGVAGDITPEQLKPLLDKSFGDLPARPAPLAVAAAVPAATGKTVVERRENIPQSVVVFGEQGLPRSDPDWYAAYVMNYILGGGGFSSRLMQEVREKRGLAYGVFTHLQPMDHAALIAGNVATANARVAESLQVIRDEWRRLRDQGVTPEELENAKTYLIGSFPLQLTSTGAIANILVSVQLDRLGIDYLDKRADLLRAVTQADVQRVAKRLLDPDKLTAVVVGAPQGLEN